MITLDKILTELQPGSLNEIVAGCGCGTNRQTGKNGNRQKSAGKTGSGKSSRSSKSGSFGGHGHVILT